MHHKDFLAYKSRVDSGALEGCRARPSWSALQYLHDAIILAAAGLQRLNLHQHIRQQLNEAIMLPACGQGALGIECRTDDTATHDLIKPLHHAADALCVQTERVLNTHLGGSCHTPIAIFCQQHNHDELFLKAKIASPDGKMILTEEQRSPQHLATALAEKCAENLKKNGALQLLNPYPA